MALLAYQLVTHRAQWLFNNISGRLEQCQRERSKTTSCAAHLTFWTFPLPIDRRSQLHSNGNSLTSKVDASFGKVQCPLSLSLSLSLFMPPRWQRGQSHNVLGLSVSTSHSREHDILEMP